ncbi:unnamed protein product [Caenorhabditis brenneri]
MNHSMASSEVVPNLRFLPVSLRTHWNLVQRDYLRYFDYYTCETVDYGEMKTAVHQYIEDKFEELSLDNTIEGMITGRFFAYAMDHYKENLDLCMDIYLLDSMWHFGDHVEARDIEWYIMYKYGPY